MLCVVGEEDEEVRAVAELVFGSYELELVIRAVDEIDCVLLCVLIEELEVKVIGVVEVGLPIFAFFK